MNAYRRPYPWSHAESSAKMHCSSALGADSDSVSASASNSAMSQHPAYSRGRCYIRRSPGAGGGAGGALALSRRDDDARARAPTRNSINRVPVA